MNSIEMQQITMPCESILLLQCYYQCINKFYFLYGIVQFD